MSPIYWKQTGELETKIISLQDQLDRGKEMNSNLQAKLKEKEREIEELENRLSLFSAKKSDNRLEEQLAEERKAFVELEKK